MNTARRLIGPGAIVVALVVLGAVWFTQRSRVRQAPQVQDPYLRIKELQHKPEGQSVLSDDWATAYHQEVLFGEPGNKRSLQNATHSPGVYADGDAGCGQTRLSYGMNNHVAGCALEPLAESQVRTPASTVLLVENPYDLHLGMTCSAFAGGNEWFPSDVAVPCYPEELCKEPVTEYGCLHPVACRHNGAVMVLFCDMHVKAHPPGTLLNGMFIPYPGRSFEPR